MAVSLHKQTLLFDNLTAAELAIIKQLFIPIQMPAGACIFNQGDEAIFLYIVVDGEVHIQFKPYDGPAMTIARIHKDGVIGWSAALGSPAYTSSAICVDECQLLRVRGEDLGHLYEKHPEIGSRVVDRLANVIAQRMRNTHGQVLELLENGLRVNLHKQDDAENLVV